MKLPYDISRCAGSKEEGEWREGCEDCLRRTSPSNPSGWQPHISPPQIIVFECDKRIPTKEQT